MSSLRQFIYKCIAQEPNLSCQLKDILESGILDQFEQFMSSAAVREDLTKLSTREEHPQWFEGW